MAVLPTWTRPKFFNTPLNGYERETSPISPPPSIPWICSGHIDVISAFFCNTFLGVYTTAAQSRSCAHLAVGSVPQATAYPRSSGVTIASTATTTRTAPGTCRTKPAATNPIIFGPAPTPKSPGWGLSKVCSVQISCLLMCREGLLGGQVVRAISLFSGPCPAMGNNPHLLPLHPLSIYTKMRAWAAMLRVSCICSKTLRGINP